jgi:curved DNA-binding protein CbpA
VAPRDPYAVLGLDPRASQAQIKAAWRRLAREHHPDLTGDPAAARRATRKMAEINAAYEAIRTGRSSAQGAPGRRARAAGPPPPPRTRPVTARVDTSTTIRPRNATTGRPAHPAGQAPRPPRRRGPEPPRASDPNGPVEHGRLQRHRRPSAPPLETASELVLEFGKFRGHTLGEVAAFEPSYVDWLASTITRDRDLVAAARVVRDDLDRRGVPRRLRESPPRRSPFAFPSD